MRIKKALSLAFFSFLAISLPALALTAVKNSSEDLFWTDPMTVHDYKKDTDLHNMAVSAMAFTELEFVRLGDSLLNLTAKEKKNPIAKSLDSLEYVYSKLPRIEPVRRFGQFWDALQLRQISLSDARLVGSVLIGDSMGGVTPIMQVRVYKLFVWVEDILYDLDRAVMKPVNWGASSLRHESTHLKSIGFAADGLGFLRWKFSLGLKMFSREVVRFSSNVITTLEKPHNAMIRRKRKKQNEKVLIYAKMPLSVFLENQSYFTGEKNRTSVGTLENWREHIAKNPQRLPDNIEKESLHIEALPVSDPSREVILATQYKTWEKTPRELKKYVVTASEFETFVREQSLDPVSQKSA